MALSLPPGLTHAEVSFLAEMEMVTVVPRQRLDSIDLLSVSNLFPHPTSRHDFFFFFFFSFFLFFPKLTFPFLSFQGRTPPLRPPHRTDLPLWLALLLKKQRRANIVPPAWLHPASLSEIVHRETKENPTAFSEPPPAPSRADLRNPGRAHRQQQQGNTETATGAALLSPPFRASCTADAPAGYLPYHWLEVAESLLAFAGDDCAALGSAGEIRGLLRDLVEVRAAKMRDSTKTLGAEEGSAGGVVSLRGVGAMELAENRGFVLGVVDGVRRIGASAEATRREEEENGGGGGGGYGAGRGGDDEEDSDEDMGI
ncbi:GINS complex protein-domain-containing protein [Cladorrhinum samala]|uniref:DNA replication complex GINS protein PSF2 n=1 Tax=Cladorrhinum samala TaxID=585594 RepID=A0AAV9HT26_9PEZI|nr:GINS complex protein-domain-containing protein [Cladorrhinum samala]